MEQICMEILDGVKYIAASTDALKILRIAWLFAVMAGRFSAVPLRLSSA